MKLIKILFSLILLINTFIVIANEQRDTIIDKNSTLELEFVFEIFECGISVYHHPTNNESSILSYNSSLDTAIYKYTPDIDFVGIDTVVFLTGCGSSPENTITDTIEYLIKVSEGKQMIFYYNETQCADKWQTGQNSTINEKRAALSIFLDQRGICFDTIRISSVYGLGEDCESCGCLSGDRYYLTAADYFLNQLSEINFKIYTDSLQNPKNLSLSYIETQCSDPWYGQLEYKTAPSPETRLYELAQYLESVDISFIALEIQLVVDLDLVEFCSACNCGTGYKYKIVADSSYANKIKSLGFKSECLPSAGFTYSILLSYPIQIDLISTAQGSDSIIWKGISNYSLNDTILGIGNKIRLKNPYDLVVLAVDCMDAPCPSTVDITQIVYNSCGVDSITIPVPVENYTSLIEKKHENLFCYPNPTNGYLKLGGFENQKDLSLQILDFSGKKLVGRPLYEREIQLNLPDGIYLLTIFEKNNLIFKRKIIVE
jgi:hypothetical protein